jgi:hypothetical protein
MKPARRMKPARSMLMYNFQFGAAARSSVATRIANEAQVQLSASALAQVMFSSFSRITFEPA